MSNWTLFRNSNNISLPPCIQDSLCLHGIFIFVWTQKNIETIQEKQSNIVKERIVEQFEMEMQVYTQDEIFNKVMLEAKSHILEEGEIAEDKEQDTRSKYPGLLKAYYEVQCNTSTVQYV